MSSTATLYERLGVSPAADDVTLRSAYRRLAMVLHPDRLWDDHDDAGRATGAEMAQVNEAWTVLSDPSKRAAYDLTLIDLTGRLTLRPPRPTFTATPAPGSRRDAWYAGIRVQIVRLTREAAMSASWALSLKRGGRPRAVYQARIDTLVAHNVADTADRIKTARSAGTAPLDLALASALVGLSDLAAVTLLAAVEAGPTAAQEVLAELVDRTWDNLAHGVSHEVSTALGSNPHLAKRLYSHR